jgi:hypothetical protein
MISSNDHQFGVARPIFGKPDDLVAHDDVFDGTADLFDNTGKVAALTRRKRRWPAIGEDALSDHDLAGIDACCLDPDEDLVRFRNRSLDLHNTQDVDSAVMVELHCTRHRVFSLPWLADSSPNQREGTGLRECNYDCQFGQRDCYRQHRAIKEI